MVTEGKYDSRSMLARWSRLSLRARGVAVLAVPMAALFGALFAAYWMEDNAQDTDLEVAGAYQAQTELLQLHVTLLNAADPQSSTPFEVARASAAQSLQHLAILLRDAPGGPAAVTEIDSQSKEELGIAEHLRTSAVSSPSGLLDRSKAVLSQIQTQLSALEQAQQRRLSIAQTNRDFVRRRFFRIATLCGVLGPLGALFVHLVLTGRLVRRLLAVEENARRLAQDLPLKPFVSGDDEITELARQIENAAFLLREREHELRGSEARYRELFDQAPIPYEETDREGVIRRFNQAVCALLKCAPDRILGCRAWDFLAPDQQESFRAALIERLDSGTDRALYECEYFLEDGSRLEVEIRETLIRDANGQVTGLCRSVMDVTERNLATMAARKVQQYAMELRNKNEQLGRALDAARSATEAKSRFLAGISHELRTPLNGIIGFSELMHDGCVGPVSDDHREFLADILTSARHLLVLINDILDLSKVESGKMEFRPERRPLHTLVQEVCDVVRPLADKKNMQIATVVPGDVTVFLDPSRFKQVLYNYLSNAVKFTPSGGQVTVRVQLTEGACFLLEVEDTGLGIDPQELSLLFKEFQQLPNSRKAEQGTGLGLALTRTIVEAQGGKVAVRSRLGHGSVFSAELPLEPTPVFPSAHA